MVSRKDDETCHRICMVQVQLGSELVIKCIHILPSSSSVSHSTLPFCAYGNWDFKFWDYFRLVARCVVHACACRSYTMSSAHIIGPKSQQWSVDTRAAWQYDVYNILVCF